MKHAVIALIALAVLCMLVTGSLVAVDRWPSDARAQDERVIRVLTSSEVTEPPGITYDVGEPCGYSNDTGLFIVGTDRQIVVRDENGTIIAMQTLEGTVQPSLQDTETDPPLDCEGDFSITLPSGGDYYTVHLGETFIRGYAAADFPLDLETELIFIGFD